MVGIDVAVRFDPPDVESLVARKLFETRVLTCASPAYLERRGVPRTPHDFAHHECLLFRDPQTGRPFAWEFNRGKQTIEIAVASRVIMDDPSAAIAACLAGQGVFQGSRAANSYTSCPTGRVSAIRSMRTIHRGICRRRRSGPSSISCRRSPRDAGA